MATQATFYERWETAAVRRMAAARGAGVAAASPYRLRELPNESVYFYRKAIDNSRLVREADPAARRRCWRLLAASCAATLLFIAMLWPNVSAMLAGYRIESLRQEQQRLLAERAALALDQARLLSPTRLEEMAKQRDFGGPSAGQVVYLNPKADGALAWNVHSK